MEKEDSGISLEMIRAFDKHAVRITSETEGNVYIRDGVVVYMDIPENPSASDV